MRGTGREVWHWTQSGVFQPTQGKSGGVADSLDEAKAGVPGARAPDAPRAHVLGWS
jgi:hypothetical protein